MSIIPSTPDRPKRATSAAWASANPILRDAELGWDSTLKKGKYGDGVTRWNTLGWAILSPTELAALGGVGGSLTSANISNFSEAVEDAVAAILGRSTHVGVSWSYNDAGNTLVATITGGGSGGLDAEAVRDTLGLALVGVGVVSVVPNDAGDTITISSTATANATDAFLLNRANHTGSQASSTLSDSTTAGRALLTAASVVAQRTALDVNSKGEAKLYATATSASTPTPSGGASVNQFVLTAQAATAAVANPSGTAIDGNYIEFVVKDNGTSRTFTWGTAYKAVDGLSLPAATTVGKTHYWLFRFNAQSAKWVLVDTRTET